MYWKFFLTHNDNLFGKSGGPTLVLAIWLSGLVAGINVAELTHDKSERVVTSD
jgi:hypothetical protein